MPHKHYTGLDSDIVDEEIIMPSTLETIDRALFEWVENLRLHSETNKGWKQTKLIWVSAERAFQMKHNKEIRDINGVLKLPLITVERTDTLKSPEKKGIMWANVVPPDDGFGGPVLIARSIQQDKTANFTNAQSARKTSGTGHGQINFKTGKASKVVIRVAMSPIPVYIETTYAVTIRTEYQQQMNDLIAPFMTKVGPFPGGAANYFMVKKDGHNFEAFIQEGFSPENNVASMEEEERTYMTKVEIKVLGYLLGEGKGADKPRITYRESVVEVKIPRERVVLGDKPEHIDDRGFYKE